MQQKKLCYLNSVCDKVVLPLDAEKFRALTTSAQVINLMKRIEAEPDSERKNLIKRQLPAIIYGCLMPEDGVRPTLVTAKPSGLCMHDWDHLPFDVRQWYAQQVSGREQALGIVLAHVSPRGEGLRLVTRLREGRTIPQEQEWLARQFGMSASVDAAVKDVTRLSFAVCQDYVLFADADGLFADASVVEQTPQPEPVVPQSAAEPVANSIASSLKYQGVPFSSIIEELFRRLATDGQPQPGERNNVLYATTRELRHTVKYNFQTLYTLLRPYFMDLPDNEVRICINSALRSAGSNITKNMLGILTELRSSQMDEDAQIGLSYPKMPQLPPFVEMIASHYPRQIRHLIPGIVLTIMGVYATRARFKYEDGRMNSFSFLTAVVGHSGSGKAFAKHLYSALVRVLEEREMVERARNDEYLRDVRFWKGDGDKPRDPKARIRLFSDDISTNQMLEYMANLDGDHALQFTEEARRLVVARKNHYANNDDIYCKAFDNAMGGKESKSRLTRNIRVQVFLNVLICGTPKVMHKLLNNPEAGLNNRFIYMHLPEQRYRGIPHYDKFTDDEMAQIEEVIDRLQALDGQFGFPFLDRTIKRWIDKCEREYDENPDETWRDLANRAAVVGYRAGVLFYFLWGCPTDKHTITKVCRLAEWMADVTRTSVYNFCGNEYDALNEDDTQLPRRVLSKNDKLFSLLSDVFTPQDVINIRIQQGESPNVSMILSRWVSRGMARKNPDGTYTKLKKLAA